MKTRRGGQAEDPTTFWKTHKITVGTLKVCLFCAHFHQSIHLLGKMTSSFGNPLIDTQTTSNAKPRAPNKTRASSSPSPRLGKSDSPIFGFPLPLPCSLFLLSHGLGWCFLGKGNALLLSLSQGLRPFMESDDHFNVQLSLSDTYLSHKHWECWLPFILVCMIERCLSVATLLIRRGENWVSWEWNLLSWQWWKLSMLSCMEESFKNASVLSL